MNTGCFNVTPLQPGKQATYPDNMQISLLAHTFEEAKTQISEEIMHNMENFYSGLLMDRLVVLFRNNREQLL